jgi:hypothetical protein
MMHFEMKKQLLSPKHCFLTTFILQEMKKGDKSQWFKYIDLLPKKADNFPVFYTAKLKNLLQGSPFLCKSYQLIARPN